jgi:hypothetical protein
VGIAAACGLRAFLPLLALGLAARFGWIELKPAAAWLQGDHALYALGLAAALEVAADKIPVLDHVLDGVGTILRPAAAALAAYATLEGWPTPWAQLAALGLGAFALLVHGIKAKLRLGSTAATLGLANPWLSALEDALAIVAIVVALLAPLLALLVLVGLFGVLLKRRTR